MKQDFNALAHRPRATALQTPWATQLQHMLTSISLPTEPSSKKKHHLDGHLEILVREKYSKVFLLLRFFPILFTLVFLPADAGSEITYTGFLPQVTEMNPTQRCWPQATGEIKDNSLLLSFQTFLAADPQSSIDLREDKASCPLGHSLFTVHMETCKQREKAGTRQSETIVRTWDFSSQTQS